MTLEMTSARVDSASGVVRTRPLSHFSHSESLRQARMDAVSAVLPAQQAWQVLTSWTRETSGTR